MQTERMPKQGRDELASSKLNLVNDDNANVGAVDPNNALIGNYTCARKSFKWTVKVAIHYVEEAVLNSFILYNKINPNKMRFMNFKLDVIEKIIIGVNRQNAPNILFHPAIGRHFLELIPRSGKKDNPQKQCQICHEEGGRKERRYQCKKCSIHPGFSLFRKISLEMKILQIFESIKRQD